MLLWRMMSIYCAWVPSRDAAAHRHGPVTAWAYGAFSIDLCHNFSVNFLQSHARCIIDLLLMCPNSGSTEVTGMLWYFGWSLSTC